MLDWLLSIPIPLILVGFFWTIPCGCRCANCLICQDNFDRANNTDISVNSPCGWSENEPIGEADIVDNQLRFNGDSIRVISNTPNPGLQYIDIAGLVTLNDIGDQFIVYFDFQDVFNNHHVQFELTSETNVEVKLFRGTSQFGDAFNFAANIGLQEPWHVCVVEGQLVINASYGFATTTMASWEVPSFWGDADWGLGTNTVINEIFVDDVIANRSDIDGCRCHHPCSPLCAPQQRIDIITGAVPEGCNDNCGDTAGIVNGASFYLQGTGALWTGATGACEILPSSEACGWLWIVSDWCPLLDFPSISWNMIIEEGDPDFDIPDRMRITYVEQWFVDPNFTQRWIIFEETSDDDIVDAFNFDEDCKGMVLRPVPQLCTDNPDGAMLCATSSLAIVVTSII